MHAGGVGFADPDGSVHVVESASGKILRRILVEQERAARAAGSA